MLTVDVSPNDGGTIEVDQTAMSPYPLTLTLTSGISVNLKAVPAPGYHFNHWSGDLSGTNNPTTVVISCNKDITANFSEILYTLTMQVNGSGSTTPTVGLHSHSEGTAVDITATPDSGWQFDSWTGDAADVDSATTTVTMDLDKTITANFSQITNSKFIGWIIGGLVLAGLLTIILIVRHRAR